MTQNLLYTNANPNPANICEGCLPLIGLVFQPGTEPPLPAHPGCYCSYFPTDAPPDAWSWALMPPAGRLVWVRKLAYILRSGWWWPLPLVFLPLLAEAQQYNLDHPQDEDEESEEDEMSPITHHSPPATPPQDMQRTFSGRLSLQPNPLERGPNHLPTYDCLFIGAGRVRREDGQESNWLIPPEVLRGSVDLFAGLASYIDHPSLFGFGWEQRPSLRDLAGQTLDPEWDEREQGIVGRIQLYDNEPGQLLASLYDQILSDQAAGIQTPEIGLSAVLWHRSHLDEETGLRVTEAITQVDSVDHVYSAGARGYVRAALSRIGWTPDASHSFYIPNPLVPSSLRSRVGTGAGDSPAGATAPDPGGHEMAPRIDQGQLGIHSPLPQGPAAEAPQQEVVTVALNQVASPVTTPIPAGAGTPATQDPILAALAQVTARLDRIEADSAQRGQLSTVQGMGDPPRAHTFGMMTGMDQVTLAVEAMLQGVRPSSPSVRPLSGIRELYTLLSGDYEMTGVFDAERIYLANVTASTMAQMVANVLNKRVMIAFAEYPQWWRPIVTIENFTSLQQIRWITLGGIGELPTVVEGAAYTELTWDDIAQRNSFVKKGGYLGLTLEAIDKDDTRSLQMAPRALAQAAWLTLGKSISAIFTASSGTGPTIYYDDSNTRVLFHTSNGNLGTTALSAAAWQATRLAMRDQAEHNSSEPLGALTAPYFLLVPAELEFTGIQTLATEQIPGSANYNVNPEAAGDTREARLAAARARVIVVDMWTDANNWAAVADPRLYPSIGLGFRFGETPEIFSVADPRAGLMFSNDVMPIKARFFYATGPIDYRGLYKHNVS